MQRDVPLSNDELDLLIYALVRYPDESSADVAAVSELVAKLRDFRE